jgi:hypothetical protein
VQELLNAAAASTGARRASARTAARAALRARAPEGAVQGLLNAAARRKYRHTRRSRATDYTASILVI